MLDFILSKFGLISISFDELDFLHNVIKRQHAEIEMLDAIVALEEAEWLDDLPIKKTNVSGSNVINFNEYRYTHDK